MGRWNSPRVSEITLLCVLVAVALLHVFAPSFDYDVTIQIWVEVVTLSAIIMISAALSSILTMWATKKRSVWRSSLISYLLVGVTPFIAWAHTLLLHIDGTHIVDVVILKTIVLVILVWASSMLGAWFSTRHKTRLPEDVTQTSTDTRHTTKSTLSLLERGVEISALVTISVALIVVLVLHGTENEPIHRVGPNTLFTAAATIMGLAAFGSALATLGQNKISIKSIAYALIPVITIQAVFMASLISDVNFPAMWWLGLTTIGLFLLVLAIVVIRASSNET